MEPQRMLANEYSSFRQASWLHRIQEMNCRSIAGEKAEYVSFNQDYTACVIVKKDGYKMVSLLPGAAPVDPTKDETQEVIRQDMQNDGYSMAENADRRNWGETEAVDEQRVGIIVNHKHKGFSQVEMLSTTSLLFAVGSGESPEFSPRIVFILNAQTGDIVDKLHFISSVLAIRASRDRLVVVLEYKAFIYNVDNLHILSKVDTSQNSNGLIALSWKEKTAKLVLPARVQNTQDGSGSSNKYKNQFLLFDCKTMEHLGVIPAHDSEIVALSISTCGKLLATASEVGTLIRVFCLEGKKQKYTFRRGTKSAKIYSLSFGPPQGSEPRYLTIASSNGSLHLYDLKHSSNRPSIFNFFKDQPKIIRSISNLLETKRSNMTIKIGRPNIPILVAVADPYRPIEG